MGQRRTIVIVGASVAGLRTAEALRNHGFDGRVLLVGAERHLPYDRPPLSKQVLSGARQPEDLTFSSAEQLAQREIEPILGSAAVGLRHDRVELAGGGELPYDELVIATGLRARLLPEQPSGPGIHVLRTVDDAVALRDRLDVSRSVLVVGAGFIGGEVAATARKRGAEVTMVEADPVPMRRALGEKVGALCARLHVEQGVEVRTQAPVRALESTAGHVVAELPDGERLEADTAVVGLGAIPNVEWLRGTDMASRDGVPCDELGAVRGLERVSAVGDVARWVDPEVGDDYRTEHWTSARFQADAVARRLAGADPADRSWDYVWSDQYRMKIQVSGRPDVAGDVDVLDGPDGALRGTVALYFRGVTLCAVVTFGVPRLFVQLSGVIGSERESVVAKVNALRAA